MLYIQVLHVLPYGNIQDYSSPSCYENDKATRYRQERFVYLP